MMKSSLRHIAISGALIICGCISTFADSMQEPDFVKAMRPIEAIQSRENAEKYLATLPLSPIEGIWEYPADETSLIILKSRHDKGHYDIYLLESVDCSLHPGMNVGQIEESADKTQFSIKLKTKLNKGLLTSPLPCSGKLSGNSDILYIKSPKIKVSFTPSLFLPTLMKVLRLGFRVRTESPADKVPDGIIKTFPTFDGNSPASSSPRYL